MYRANVKKELFKRLERLIASGRLHVNPTETNLYLAVAGDKGALLRDHSFPFVGGKHTKIGCFFLNVEKVSDPRNFSLLAIYKGSDSVQELRSYCSALFEQLNALHNTPLEFTTDSGTVRMLLSMYYLSNDYLNFLLFLESWLAIWHLLLTFLVFRTYGAGLNIVCIVSRLETIRWSSNLEFSQH